MRHGEPTHVVGLDEVTGEHPAGTDTTVIGALGTGETHLGPAKDLAVGVKEGVLLLETEPWDLLFARGGARQKVSNTRGRAAMSEHSTHVLGEVHLLLGVVPVVGGVGATVVVVALAEDEDVVTATERVLEDGSWFL